jgi:hypothetical protein
MTQTANDFLMGGSVPSAKFPTPGTTIGGRITRIADVIQQRDFDSGAPKFWDDGSPMMQLPVEVATDQRDPDLVGDDGTRTIYIKGFLKQAVQEAVRRSGAKGLTVGGTLTVTYVGDGEAKRRGANPPKQYTATYEPPSVATANAFINQPTTQAASAQQPAQTQPAGPVDPGAIAAALGALSAEQRAALGLPTAAA